MTNVIIIGAGGHAAEIDEYIIFNEKVTRKKEINIIGFLDDNPANYARYKFSAPYIGGASDHKVLKDHAYIIGIANLDSRHFFVEKYKSEGAVFVSFVHIGAYMSMSSLVGEGCVIGPNANIGPNVTIGAFTLINSRCSIGHDTMIGNFNSISPNVCFSGFSQVGDDNIFGINSATLPSVKVGNRNKIAAGMILDRDVGNDTVVFHRFRERVFAVPKLRE